MPETTQSAPATPAGGVDEAARTGILDLNDPNVHYGRTEAMNAMRARRRQTALEDMAPADRASYEASQTAPAGTTDEDTDPDAAAAEAERKRLEAVAASGETPEPEIEPVTSQIERQTALPTVLAGDDLAKVKVRIKVLGEERDVPLSELVADTQKIGAGDAYLAKAKDVLAEVDARLAAVSAAAAKGGTAPPAPAQPAKPEDLRAAVGQALDHMFHGRESEAADGLVAAITAAQPATAIDRGAIVREVAVELAKSSALRRFAKDNPDVMSDDIRRVVADRLLNRELKELGVSNLEQLPPDQIDEVVARAGVKTREYLGLKPLRPGTPERTGREAPTSLSERKLRKDKIDELPAASVRAGVVEAPPRTTSDVIANMARARGQLRDPTERTQ